MESKKVNYRNPWTFIPSLYFIQGLPNVIITGVLDIIYKSLGIPNAQITAFTSLLNFPWVLKPLWAPFVDIYSTKRKWVLYTQLAMIGCLILAAFSFTLPNFFFLSLLAFSVAAFISATYDIAADGYYMLALSPEQQALFAGIRNVAFRVALIFGTGFLVAFAGQLGGTLGNIPLSWSITLGLSALIFGASFIYHQIILPFPDSDLSNAGNRESQETAPFLEVIASYFRQPKIWATLAFILLYRFAEVMLGKVGKLFLLDYLQQSGLDIASATKEVGIIYGTFGVTSLIIGGVLGGLIVSRYGLKKTIWPLALALNVPDVFYVYIASRQLPVQWLYPLISIEQFGYGLGFTAFMIYLMYTSKGKYKTSHYAISTGFMALGKMVAEFISGPIQQGVGYYNFFIIVCILTIPGMITILFLPLNEVEQNQKA
ncbi:MFS transporter [Microcoleus sp. FACHB-672]|uniref:MFS transporter n=1 Tax=Microcoleus sp. FACHB-672 TaxID=2692825 RepID=UPI0016821F82|nr:MFS transporter [Microcoleus sp. FACHB-672]MBD2042432.1 MFS transporter [Microcoleus sp. FACHB-672]